MQCDTSGSGEGIDSGSGNADLRINTITGIVTFDSSSRKFKENIVDLALDTTKIHNLRPVSFKFKDSIVKDDDGNILETAVGENSLGYIAEEVHDIIPELVGYDANNDPISFNYKLLTVLLVEEVKKLRIEVDALKNG